MYLLTLLGCAGASRDTSTLTCNATVSDNIQTVVEVTWKAPGPGTSTVVFDDGVTDPITTPESTDTDVHLDLLGMPEDTDVNWTGTTVFEDGSSASCSGVTHTGNAPSDVPSVEVLVDDPARDPAPYVIGVFYEGAGSDDAVTLLAAYRRDGTLVWYFEDEPGSSGLDMHYAAEGGIWFNQFTGQMGDANAYIKRVSLAGTLIESHNTPLAHHTFCELPDGTLTYQTVDIRDFTDPETGETQPWVGDGLVELIPGVSSSQVFSTWDVLDAHSNTRSESGTTIYSGVDWTHGNLVRYDAASNDYTLSLAHADDILRIDRSTGDAEVIWGLDGLPADPQFDYQHDPNWLGDGNLLMFTSDDTGAGAVEYEVGDAGLTEVWRAPFEVKPIALGQARRMSNGDTYVNGGVGGDLYEVAPDGTKVWEMRAETGKIFAQFVPVPDLYTGS